ncbi:WD domain G-beta repeat [Leishmania donovani]|uniref:WD domain, G-beta repeat family protein n=1 Tax=Leishmania donovani TaxID=5661 RepID=A0A504X260_LEIDO|nr:WD domain, G-beta repeat family protein [Leishmania donovani]CAJ1993819.1 WD domain G-beta repeat [Leishmania donovani]VDZ49640.1 WD_domain_G-beta_repeat_putative/Pfam:PF00400 [Leishmania donovani]
MPSTAEESLPPLFVLQEHADPVLSCRFYPSEVYQRDESSWFLSGDAGGLVVLWNLSTRRKMISFSALTEAHRQLCGISQHRRNCGTPVAGGLMPENEVLLEQAGTPAFGPHSQSILSVGFIPLSLSSPQPTVVTENRRVVADALARDSDAEVSSGAVCPAVFDHAARGTSDWAHPGRPRFRLSRRAPTRSVSSEQASSSTGDVLDSGAPGSAFTPSSTICFYTHCRDQRVYIWCLERQCTDAPASSPATRVPQLVVVLTAPQHGFCPVESISKAASPFTRTYLAVPHESGGEVTIWELSWRQPNTARLTNSRELEGKGASDDPRSSSGNANAYEEEEEEVNTSGMNPMDALIARAAAEEQRQAKMKQKSTRVSRESDFHHPYPSSAFPDSVVSRGERASILCYVDPAATTTSSNFSVRRLCTFSACPTFKGGTIMRLTMCHDAQHLTVAFESGHIVLARYRDADVIDVADQPRGACHAGGSLPVARVRNVTRAFADSALVCWWSGRRVLACSSEGGMHCYDVSATAEGLLEVHLVWSVTLRKGIGSVFLQRNLIVAGCWDSTLRLYDARDGRIVSILSYQRETINEVRTAPPSIARVAAFGFDVRKPRLYAGLPGALSTKSTACIASNSTTLTQGSLPQFSESPLRETYVAGTPAPHSSSESLAAEEQLVYLFASASKDCTVALWRVDLGLVVEQTAREAITA